MEGEAWVTLATNDEYSLGALVLAHSLKRCQTQKKIVVMVTSALSDSIRVELSETFDAVVDVEALDSKDAANLALLERPELGITFTKINCWKLTQYSKCVFLDADTLVVQNCDELFQREEFSAAPDPGWPDCFNSGVFVFVPSVETYEKIMSHAAIEGSFDGGDQGLLNSYFSDWAYTDIQKHLPFLYNMVATATYSYLPAYKRFGKNVKIVHFIGASKPWKCSFDQNGDPVPNLPEDSNSILHLRNWWNIHKTEILPNRQRKTLTDTSTNHNNAIPISSDIKETATFPETLTATSTNQNYENTASSELNEPSTLPDLQDVSRGTDKGKPDSQRLWEQGRQDYMGAASTDNILQKIDESIASTDIKPMTEDDERNKMMWEQGQPDIMGSASTDNILRKLDNAIGKPNQGK